MTAPTWKDTPWGQELETEHGIIRLELRPSHCDRGVVLAHLETKHTGRDCTPCNVDHADLWPRFYYDEGRAKLEIDAFLRVRQWIARDESAIEPTVTPALLAKLVLAKARAAAVILLIKRDGHEDGFALEADGMFELQVGGRVGLRALALGAMHYAARRLIEDIRKDSQPYNPDGGA